MNINKNRITSKHSKKIKNSNNELIMNKRKIAINKNNNKKGKCMCELTSK